MSSRRSLLSGLSAILTTTAFPRIASAQQIEAATDIGDPGGAPDQVIYDETLINGLTDLTKALGIRKAPKALAARLITVASSYIGVSRTTAPDQVEKFLALFLNKTRDPSGRLYAYCAAGVSWSACQAYCDIKPSDVPYDPATSLDVFQDTLSDINKFYFRPHCSVPVLLSDSRRRGTWTRKDDVKIVNSGWLVLYDWNGDGVPDHVGIVETLDQDTLHTIEFNTSVKVSGDQINGGVVARKERPLTNVMGYIAWYS